MAETPSCSGSGAGNNSTGNGLLLDEKHRVANQVIAVMNESEDVWKQVSAKQLVVERLYAEQIVVSDIFTQYNITWRELDFSNTANIDGTEIDNEVQALLQLLEAFEAKLDKSAAIIKGFIREMIAHIAALKGSLQGVRKANTFDDLSKVAIPNLDWIQAIPDPEIEILDDEWSQMNLQPKITEYFQQLQLAVGPITNQSSPEPDMDVHDD